MLRGMKVWSTVNPSAAGGWCSTVWVRHPEAPAGGHQLAHGYRPRSKTAARLDALRVAMKARLNRVRHKPVCWCQNPNPVRFPGDPEHKPPAL